MGMIKALTSRVITGVQWDVCKRLDIVDDKMNAISS